jgi:hypothetical protein
MGVGGRGVGAAGTGVEAWVPCEYPVGLASRTRQRLDCPTMTRLYPRLLPLAVVALALGFAACGGDSDSGSSSTAASPPPSSAEETTPEQQEQDQTESSADKGEGGAVEFEVKGGDNSIQRFGSEADSSELDAAAAALQGFFDARVAGDWAGACTYLSKGAVEGFEQLAGGSKQLKGAGCGAILGTLSEGVPKGALEEAAQVDAGALRVEGERAFLLYHGAQGVDYAIPIAEEGGEWKVAALAGTPIS